jgi:16S rRNA processing protein RimM
VARLVVGLVRGLHGLRGAVRIEILTDDTQRFEPGSVVYPEGTDTPLTVAHVRADRPPGLLVTFHEIADRNSAEGLRDVYLEAEVDETLPEGTHYWHEIVGSRVSSQSGRDLGEVTDVFRVGEAEVYSVRGTDGGELLIPAVGGIVVELAPAEKRIVVDTVALGLE